MQVDCLLCGKRKPPYEWNFRIAYHHCQGRLKCHCTTKFDAKCAGKQPKALSRWTSTNKMIEKSIELNALLMLRLRQVSNIDLHLHKQSRCCHLAAWKRRNRQPKTKGFGSAGVPWMLSETKAPHGDRNQNEGQLNRQQGLQRDVFQNIWKVEELV